jgi:hypothetical protein
VKQCLSLVNVDTRYRKFRIGDQCVNIVRIEIERVARICQVPGKTIVDGADPQTSRYVTLSQVRLQRDGLVGGIATFALVSLSCRNRSFSVEHPEESI